MDKNFTLSIKGTFSFSASCNTLQLNDIQDNSRLKNLFLDFKEILAFEGDTE